MINKCLITEETNVLAWKDNTSRKLNNEWGSVCQELANRPANYGRCSLTARWPGLVSTNRRRIRNECLKHRTVAMVWIKYSPIDIAPAKTAAKSMRHPCTYNKLSAVCCSWLFFVAFFFLSLSLSSPRPEATRNFSGIEIAQSTRMVKKKTFRFCSLRRSLYILAPPETCPKYHKHNNPVWAVWLEDYTHEKNNTEIPNSDYKPRQNPKYSERSALRVLILKVIPR